MSSLFNDAAVRNQIDPSSGLAWAIGAIAKAQGRVVDRLRLHQVVTDCAGGLATIISNEIIDVVIAESDNTSQNWQRLIQEIIVKAGIGCVELSDRPDPARMPALTWVPDMGWAVIRALTPQNQWLIDFQGVLRLAPADKFLHCIRIIWADAEDGAGRDLARRMIREEFLKAKPILIESGVAGALTNILALGISMYSMQVYDRVIPTQGYATLVALTLGVVIALGFDVVIKFARSYLMEHAITQMDGSLSRQIFSRFLNIRLDQLPSSVGSLSAQLRGYESIRGFLSTSTFYVLVDAPFGVFFVLIIALIAGPIVALVPLVFLILSLAFGFVMSDKINNHALKSTAASNKKTGILVEAIEGAETIKSGGGSWGALSRWIDNNEESLIHEMALRSINEKSNYLSGMLQQVSYIGLIASGAYFAAEGQMTMGALIACSILSGRAMGPIGQIPGLIIQAAQASAALKNLENIFALESDNHGVERPLVPDQIKGEYDLERIHYAYPNAPKALAIKKLKIAPGEKIGVIGSIGSGKSTLLRILTGMHQVGEGRVLLDGMDIDQISRHFLSEHIGYLQQDHRLFSGSLRENLLVGIPDPGDAILHDVAKKTGLLSVIANHPKGLDLSIVEGGRGLSGGQKQLVAFTRLLLSKPNIWLLDEPTASMDGATELGCLVALKASLRPEDTMVLVTHKPSLLAMTTRIIVVAQHEIVLDGQRDEVLKVLGSIGLVSQGGHEEQRPPMSGV